MSLGNKTKKELHDTAKELSDELKKAKKEIVMLSKKLESAKETGSTSDLSTLPLNAVSMAISNDLKTGTVYEFKFNPETKETVIARIEEFPSIAYASMHIQEFLIEKIENQILKGE